MEQTPGSPPNALMPASPQSAPGPGLALQPQTSPGGPPSDTLSVLAHQHAGAKAQYQQLQGVMQKSDAVRRELATLSQLGDQVTTEDVIKGAGKLVGAGLDPHALAGLLADMPTNGGPALAQWVQMHEQGAAEGEAQMAPQLAQARHAQGLAGLRLMAAAHPSFGQGGQPGAPPASATPGAGVQTPGT